MTTLRPPMRPTTDVTAPTIPLPTSGVPATGSWSSPGPNVDEPSDPYDTKNQCTRSPAATVPPLMTPTGRLCVDSSSGSGPGSAPEAFDPAELGALSDTAVREAAAEAGRQMAAWAGRLVACCAELERREGWRAEGATSLVSWLAERCGVSVATARALAQVGERLSHLPHLAGALAAGEVSFDKVRTVIDAAGSRNEAELVETAGVALCASWPRWRVRQRAPPPLGPPNASTTAGRCASTTPAAPSAPHSRPTPTPRCAPGSRARRAKTLESSGEDGETLRWDQRLADALVTTVRAGGDVAPGPSSTPKRRQGADDSPGAPSPYLVVAHVPLATLVDEAGDLAGELERHGLISAGVVRRLACDAAVVVALDDDVGHTLYEGRARRDPSDAQRRELWRRDRHCRFPGCANAIFTHPHHLEPWHPDGPTDLDNLVLLCEHHHRRMHAREWSVEGNANEELSFVGPSGRVMTSQPSPLWTRVTGPAARGNSVTPSRGRLEERRPAGGSV